MIQWNNLSFTYPGEETPALLGTEGTIKEGEITLLCGPSGCGKTTLLRLLKPELAPVGKKTGEILFQGKPIEEVTQKESAEGIGFLRQDIKQQIVTEKVWQELAFGPENIGLSPEEIHRRAGETAAWMGMESWFDRKTATLSGGQQQLVSLAALLMMRPKFLLLDEPTGWLDPVAAKDFLEHLRECAGELGIGILLVEHRLEEIFSLAHQVLYMEEGKILFQGTPTETGAWMGHHSPAAGAGLPVSIQCFATQPFVPGTPCPLTLQEGRNWLKKLEIRETKRAPQEKQKKGTHEPALLKLEDVDFSYSGPRGKGEKQNPVLKHLNLTLTPGNILVIVGGNGTGKSTLLRVAAGILPPTYGKKHCEVPLAMLPQDPLALFGEITVLEELEETEKHPGSAKAMAEKMGLAGMLSRHPYDLSGGQRQRLAIGKLLLTEPKVLLLDEPTKGLDPGWKKELTSLLQQLSQEGLSILCCTHDLEFGAETGDRVGMLFHGDVLGLGTPEEFFGGNAYYTTPAARLSRDLFFQGKSPFVRTPDLLRELALAGKERQKERERI